MITRISKVETRFVLEKLVDYSREHSDQQLLKDSIKISSRFQVLNNKQKNGEISHDVASNQLAQVNNSIIELLMEYEKE